MNGAALGWACVLLVIGCGSGSPPPKTASDEAAVPEPAKASPAGENEQNENPGEAEKSATEEPKPTESEETKAPESLSPGDLTSVLQAMLGDPELDAYLHTEKPGRSPVKVAGPDLPKDLKVVKGSHYVSIVDGPKSPKDPVVVITRIGLDGSIVTIAYHYDVEGIHGTTRIKNGKAGWELMSSRIIGQ